MRSRLQLTGIIVLCDHLFDLYCGTLTRMPAEISLAAPLPVTVVNESTLLPRLFKVGARLVAYGLLGGSPVPVTILAVSGAWAQITFRFQGIAETEGWVFLPACTSTIWTVEVS